MQCCMSCTTIPDPATQSSTHVVFCVMPFACSSPRMTPHGHPEIPKCRRSSSPGQFLSHTVTLLGCKSPIIACAYRCYVFAHTCVRQQTVVIGAQVLEFESQLCSPLTPCVTLGKLLNPFMPVVLIYGVRIIIIEPNSQSAEDELSV